MVSPCIVHLCRNIGTHRFPKNEVRRAQWIQTIKHIKPGLNVRNNSLICSAHFRHSDFAITPMCFTKLDRAPKILKKTAVPSVFPWNHAYQEQPSSSQDSLIFDPTNVQTTYLRTPSIAFVEEQPFLDTITSDLFEDPLQGINHETEDTLPGSEQGTEESLKCSDQETEESHLHGNPDDYNLLEIEIEDLRLGDRQLNVVEQHNKSVQTEERGMCSSCTQCDNIVQTPNEGMGGFSIYQLKDNAKSLHFYTGLENLQVKESIL